MNVSVLEKTCTDQDRPYSCKELEFLHKKLHKDFRLSKTFITHSECKHSYYCKSGGKKETEYKETKNTGSCSVCWKIKNTPKELKKSASKLVTCYMGKNPTSFETPISYYWYEIEKDFYRWLYERI